MYVCSVPTDRQIAHKKYLSTEYTDKYTELHMYVISRKLHSKYSNIICFLPII